jgi:hypothetical protein
LLERTGEFLERGGGVALHVLVAGSEILRSLPEIFDEWIELLLLVARQGNASLVAFVRGSPRWATTPYNADCAPIHPTKYARFAAFLAAAVAR